MDIKKAEELLKGYHLPYSESYLAKDIESAVKYANKIGFPVVVKVFTKEPVHKTDVGGIKLDLINEKEVRHACILIKRIKGFKGFLIQKMERGHEVAIGIKKDPSFGSVIMFGYGGIYVEVLKDVTFRIAPITKSMALDMIKEIRAYPILKGHRGKPSNIKALVKILLKTSKLALNEEFKEIDLNPIFVNEKEAKIADVRVIE